MSDIYNFEKRKDEQTLIKTDTGKRKKEQFIQHLREGDVINDFFAIKLKNPPRAYKRGTWFDIIVSDKTGEISIKYWGGDNKDRVKRLYDSFSIGDVVQIRSGMVELYDEKPQISINENTGGIRRCSPNEYDISDFIAALDEQKIKQLYQELHENIKLIKNQQIKNLLSIFFDDPSFVNEYTRSPSAISHHHNYIGGNLEHSVGVLRLCKNISEMYQGIDTDLLICGAILHDVGKLKEYEYTAAVDKTDEGNFIGHIVIGERWLRDKISQLRQRGSEFSKELEMHLRHIILSHHGRYEYGSPRLPKTVEACIIHQADLMDSQVKHFLQKLDDARKVTDDDWAYIYDSDAGKKRPIFLGQY
ncbi:MAG: HD domain-containing protein [Thermoplasmatota archaeon]